MSIRADATVCSAVAVDNCQSWLKLLNAPSQNHLQIAPSPEAAVDTQLRQVLAWFEALFAPTCVYLTGGDFRQGRLTSESTRSDLVGLTDTLIMLSRRFDPSSLGPIPLASKFT